MAILLDSSILLRLANASDPSFLVAGRAVSEFRRKGEPLCVAAQNLVEFRNSASRPANVNGLGLAPGDADQYVSAFESLFDLLPETPAIYPAWKALVAAAGVIGKQVHDARLAAVCQVGGISHVLTFNVRHFTRFVPFVPGLSVIDPTTV